MVKKITRVVIAGGGFAGVKTALELSNKPEFAVTLISNNTHFEYHGALYRSAVGHSPLEVVIPLKTIFKGVENVEIVLDSVGFIDEKNKRIASATGNIYSYDVAVLALGNQVNYFDITGLKEHVFTMHDIPSTIRLRSALVDIFKKPHTRSIRLAIIGAGPAGVELAGELHIFAALVAKHYKQPKPKVKVLLIETSDRILPSLQPKASAKAAQRLNELGVEVHLNTSVESCLANTVCLQAGDLHADAIIWTAGSKPVDFYSQNASIFSLGRAGRVLVDDYLRARGQSDIYVLGDNADSPYAGMAQTALHDALFLARNLCRPNKKQWKTYKPKKPIYVITVGQKWAVVQSGSTIHSGYRGWLVRRKADLAIFKNFQPYKQAIATWRNADKMAKL